MEQNNLVYVRRQPNDSAGGFVPLDCIRGIKIGNVTGGYQVFTGRYYYMGRIHPGDVVEGAVSHSGEHDYDAHGIKVCLIKSRTNPEVWEKIRRLVGRDLPVACTERIRQILLEKGDMTRAELREMMPVAYEANTVTRALRTMIRDGRIIAEGSNHSPNQKLKLSQLCDD